MDDPLLNLMSRHFLALGCHYESFNSDGSLFKSGFALISGFFMEINDTGFWVTAGHCLKELTENMERGTLRIVDGGFMDYCSNEAVHCFSYPYIFNPNDAVYFDRPEFGLDCGLIKLDLLKCKAFMMNRCIPILEELWRNNEGMVFDAYKMLGVSAETVVADDQSIRMMRSSIRIHPLPPDHPAVLEHHPDWFVGRLDEACPLESIEGMSGGPIYGLKIVDHRFIYRPIALQSRWNHKTRIVYGCPLQYFGEEVHDYLAKVRTSIDDESK